MEPTTAEMIFWIVLLVAALIFIGLVFIFGREPDPDPYAWITEQEERNKE